MLEMVPRSSFQAVQEQRDTAVEKLRAIVLPLESAQLGQLDVLQQLVNSLKDKFAPLMVADLLQAVYASGIQVEDATMLVKALDSARISAAGDRQRRILWRGRGGCWGMSGGGTGCHCDCVSVVVQMAILWVVAK